MTNFARGRVLVALVAGVLIAAIPALAQPAPSPFGEPAIQVRNQPSYYVWIDQAGWHVRWSTPYPQLFSGLVTTDGEFRDLRRVGGLPSWLSRLGNNRAVFATWTLPGSDGFDFTTTGSTITFRLAMNAFQVHPSQVYIGRASMNPAAVPFTLVASPYLVQQQVPGNERARPVDVREARELNR